MHEMRIGDGVRKERVERLMKIFHEFWEGSYLQAQRGKNQITHAILN
jgi:hypothetical protein